MDSALKTTINNLELVHEEMEAKMFILRRSGELPGQFLLEYHKDRRCRKFKGRIDLDQCQQVDAGLSLVNRKERYQYMFNVKTPKRIYYLVAKNENDMNRWVDAICQVCSLKAYTQDEEQNCQMFSFDSQKSPSITSTSTMLSPYIPISECISGQRLNVTNSLSSITGQAIDSFDIARRLVPSPSRSVITDAQSIINDDESLPSLPNVNWHTFPSSGDLKPGFRPCNAGIGSWSVKKRFGKLRIVDSDKPPDANETPIPPRPPKPSCTIDESPVRNYLNLDGKTKCSKPTTSSMPTQQTECNKHHNPGPSKNEVKITKALTTKSQITELQNQTQKPQDCFCSTDDHFLRCDFDSKNNNNINNNNNDNNNRNNNDDDDNLDNTRSTVYHNPSSPFNEENANTVLKINGSAPPLVFRELKPGRKASDPNISIHLSPFATYKDVAIESMQFEPPNVNRKLKSQLTNSTIDDLPYLSSPLGREKTKSMHSPTLVSTAKKGQNLSSSNDDSNLLEDKEEIYFYQDNYAFSPTSAHHLLHLQYLDLDLEKSENENNATSAQPSQGSLSATVYKTVDFVKTEAFNRTRQKVEKERKQCSHEITS